MDSIIARSSLERLKGLDAISGLRAQLEEARQLCTHAARAYMVAKWIFGRLKTNDGIEPDTWMLLLDCLRILSPERIGTLLTSHDILEHSTAALDHLDAPHDLITSIVAVLRFVLDLSTSTHGTSVEAALKTTAVSAASFFGSWLRFIHIVTSSDHTELSQAAISALLSPGVELWNLRRLEAEENQLFAQHCLVPAALLLSSKTICDSDGSIKRKRSAEKSLHSHSGKPMLESLLARHIFAAGRKAFWREPSRPDSLIRELLKPLSDTYRHPEVLPELLDVALRCSSTSTLRQRTKEGPWVEELFTATLACNLNDADQLIEQTVLSQLLSTVRRYTSLSIWTLKGLYDRHVDLQKTLADPSENFVVAGESNTSNDPAIPPMWALIFELVVSDRDIFDKAAVRDILEAVSKSRQHSEPFAQSLEQSIVIPIMKAFAKRRDLATFMDIWSRHAGLDGIAEDFSELVEESFTEHAFLQEVQKYHNLIDDMTSNDLDQSTVGTVCVVDEALLAGARTQNRQDAIFPKLDELLNLLINLTTKPESPTSHGPNEGRGPSQERHRTSGMSWTRQASFWSLFRTAFEMWFPNWRSQGHSQEMTCTKGDLYLTTAVSTAFEAIALDVSEPTSAVVRAAGTFITSVCLAFTQQACVCTQDCRQIWSNTVQRLHKSVGSMCVDIIPRYSNTLELVDGQKAKEFFTVSLNAVIAAANGRSEDKNRAHVLLQAMQSLAISTATKASAKTMDNFIGVLIDQLKFTADDATVDNITVGKEIILTILCSFPTHSIARDRRKDIVSSLFEDQMSSRGWDGYAVRNLRLALLVKLMELPNATCVLSTEVDALWRIALKATNDTSAHDTDRKQEKATTLMLLDELAQLTVNHLLATQEQERTRAILLGMGEQIKDHMESIQTAADLNGSPWKIQMIKAIATRLEAGCRQPLMDQLAYRNPEILGAYLNRLVEETWVPNISKDDPTTVLVHQDWLAPALSSILSLPSDFMPYSAIVVIARCRHTAIVTMLDSIAATWDAVEGQTEGDGSSVNVSDSLSAMVSRYWIGCKYGNPNGKVLYAALADAMLRLPIQPRERRTLFYAFTGFLDEFDNNQKIELVKKLYETTEGVAVCTLQLIDVCLSKLEDSNTADGYLSNVRLYFNELLGIFASAKEDLIRQAAAKCVTNILQSKPFVPNQYLVEETLEAIRLAVFKREVSSVVYLETCTMIATLLLQYRARLRGRYHLVVKGFQAMVTTLFTGIHHRGNNNPTIACANRLTRLLVLFCEPPHIQRQTKITSLVDESRKEQAYVGQYVRYLLHHYCTQVLAATPAEGLREALTPALWSMIEAMEISDAEGIKSLSAAMNNSERAVLRGVYDDWRRFGKWRGG